MLAGLIGGWIFSPFRLWLRLGWANVMVDHRWQPAASRSDLTPASAKPASQSKTQMTAATQQPRACSTAAVSTLTATYIDGAEPLQAATVLLPPAARNGVRQSTPVRSVTKAQKHLTL